MNPEKNIALQCFLLVSCPQLDSSRIQLWSCWFESISNLWNQRGYRSSAFRSSVAYRDFSHWHPRSCLWRTTRRDSEHAIHASLWRCPLVFLVDCLTMDRSLTSKLFDDRVSKSRGDFDYKQVRAGEGQSSISLSYLLNKVELVRRATICDALAVHMFAKEELSFSLWSRKSFVTLKFKEKNEGRNEEE